MRRRYPPQPPNNPAIVLHPVLPLNRQNAYRERYRRLVRGWQPSGEQYEARVRRYVGSTTVLLDLGCGRGGLIEKLGPQVAWPVGIDSDRLSLQAHRSPLTRRSCARAEALPFAANTFDVVVSSWLLEHLAQPQRVLNEVARVLRPGGHFVTLTPNANHPILLANRLSQLAPRLQRRLVPGLYGRRAEDTFAVYYRANTYRHLVQLARVAGLHLAHYRPIADPTYLAFNDVMFRLASWAERLIPHALKVHLLLDFEKL